MSLIEVSLVIFSLSLPILTCIAFWAKRSILHTDLLIFCMIAGVMFLDFPHWNGDFKPAIYYLPTVLLVCIAISWPGLTRLLIAIAAGALGIYYQKQGVHLPTEHLTNQQVELYSFATAVIVVFITPFFGWLLPRSVKSLAQLLERISTLFGLILLSVLVMKLDLIPDYLTETDYSRISCILGLSAATILIRELLTMARQASCMEHALLKPFAQMAEELHEADADYVTEEISNLSGTKEDYFHWVTNKLITSAAETQTAVVKAIARVEKLSRLFKSDKVSPKDFRVDTLAHETLGTLEKLIAAQRTTPAQTEELTSAAENLRDAFREYQIMMHPQRISWANSLLRSVADTVQNSGQLSPYNNELERARELLEAVIGYAEDFGTEVVGEETQETQKKIESMLAARQAIYGVAQEILKPRVSTTDNSDKVVNPVVKQLPEEVSV
ncbi:MAG: hypothetical protein PHC51_08170 [bacterium]|nr:hypothetical protein [bacterium]